MLEAKHDDDDVRRLLESVRMLAAKPLYPAVLSTYALDDVEKQKRCLWALLVLYVRHSVVGKLENSRLETVVYGIAQQVRASGDVEEAIAKMVEFAPNDGDFASRFETVQVSESRQARYLLREIEDKTRGTGELAVELPDRVHVEHIYPKAPAFEKWPEHNAVIDRLGEPNSPLQEAEPGN